MGKTKELIDRIRRNSNDEIDALAKTLDEVQLTIQANKDSAEAIATQHREELDQHKSVDEAHLLAITALAEGLKTVTDVLVGVTQVLKERGYLHKNFAQELEKKDAIQK